MREYGQDEDCERTDPGNQLRAALSKIEAPASPSLADLLYTADERGILPFKIDEEDALTVVRLFILATEIGANRAKLTPFRM